MESKGNCEQAGKTMLFRVRRTVSRNANTDANDAIAVKRALSILDLYQEAEWDLSPEPDEPMFQGIQRFQIDNGLDPDGVITPGGPTERALDDRFRARYERLATESRQAPKRRPTVRKPQRSRSLLAHAEPFGAGLSLGATSPQPSAAATQRLAFNTKAGDQGVGAWSEASEVPDTREQELRRAETYMRNKIESWRRKGYDAAADNLEWYLSGRGGTKLYTREQARRFPQMRAAEQENRENFEDRTFRGVTENNPAPRRLKTMEDGETLRFTDEWDSRFVFEEFVRDGLLGSSLERDFARAAGKTNLLSMGTFTATRRGDRIEIKGTVTHFWGARDRDTGRLEREIYDFHGAQPGATEARVLERYGRARPFAFGAEWRQRVTGFIPIEGHRLGRPNLRWMDVAR